MFLLVTTIILWNFLSKVLKIYHRVFFFFFSVLKIICYQVLNSAHGCIYTSHSGSFIPTFTTRWQIIIILLFHMKQILILVMTIFVEYIYQVIWRLSIATHSIWIKFIFFSPFAYVPTLLFWMGGSCFERTAPALPFLPKIYGFEMILT